MSDPAFLGLAEAAELIRAKKLSPVEYAQALFARIERRDAAYNCFIALTPERALKSARDAETEIMAGRWRGPLHGIPYALKDIIDVAGLPTTAHSKILADNVAQQDAPAAARMVAAGGVLLGKLATHEFAIGGPSFDLPWPPARNPWNRNCIPGGSTSGGAAGLAAGFFPATLGSDTGGSIRNPASFCGITGMKPTYGRVSRRGVVPLAFSLDHVGPLTRNVRDNALLLQVIAGHDPQDPASADRPVPDYAADLDRGVKGLKVGVIRHFYAQDLKRGAPEQVAAIETAVTMLADRGARISEIALPPLADFNACGQVILAAEAYSVHEAWLKERPQDYGARGRERLLAGATLRVADYLRATRWRRTLCEAAAAAFKDIDVAITATSVDPACRFDDTATLAAIYGRQVLMPFNVTGQPALSVPAGFSKDGLPLSVQFVGHPFAEATVYRVAQAYEAASGWADRHPPDLAV
ncbi:MAG: Asp-tRNA(Asn)/Glu-tRNA(Gln) amidotransferase subunit GatA [Proteobacteria bacterium]|nr:Asp-tRNA(Asn)/Glu-tRNA(Gln) amidotransferase subunit GatA [Pseudomonadota bacterium]